jgi:hypothetical protein
MRACGRRDSHRQIGFIRGYGFCPFRGRVSSLQRRYPGKHLRGLRGPLARPFEDCEMTSKKYDPVIGVSFSMELYDGMKGLKLLLPTLIFDEAHER